MPLNPEEIDTELLPRASVGGFKRLATDSGAGG
jgi:hypothetical protein